MKKVSGSLLDKMAPVIRFEFGDGPEDVPLLKARISQVTQYVHLAASENPEARLAGKQALEKLMRQCLEAELGQYVGSVKQSLRGAEGARIRWGDASREVVARVIASLAIEQDNLGYKSTDELWPLFYSELDNERLGPKETGDGLRVSWEGNSKGITRKRFNNLISEARGNSPKT